MTTCYYCLHNIKDERCEFDIEGYPLPSTVDCRHFEFDTGESAILEEVKTS